MKINVVANQPNFVAKAATDANAKFKKMFADLNACAKERQALETAFTKDFTKLLSDFNKKQNSITSRGSKISKKIEDLAESETVELLEDQSMAVEDFSDPGIVRKHSGEALVKKQLGAISR